MRKAALSFLAVMILVADVLAAPATRPAATSRPTTEPARADPKFVAEFNERIADSVRGGTAKYADVIAKLREVGAPLSEKPGRIELGYSWEYAEYQFSFDEAGMVYKFEFTPAHWPNAPGSDAYARNPEYKLKPGNKWWLVKARIFQHDDAQADLAPQQRGGMVKLELTQARTADEAAQKLIAKRKQDAIKTAKAMKTPVQDWLARMDEVEVHEWFTPRLTGRKAERIN